jgi:hypothetical protein
MSLSSSRAENPWAIGVTVFAAAILLMAGGAQFWTAIGLAVVNGVLNFMWLPSQPFWGIVLIAIDVLVIWALASTGQAAAARS